MLCDNLEAREGVGVGRRFRRKGRVYLRLTHNVVRQKPTQHCKAIILQLKIKKIELRN